MKLSIYYIDAFTKSLFSGNPAAVIFSNLDNTMVMQNIAAENNLSETAFISYRDNKYFQVTFFSITKRNYVQNKI